METNNYKVAGTIERSQHRIFLCVYLNGKQVMKADVSNMKQKSREYWQAKTVRMVHKSLDAIWEVK